MSSDAGAPDERPDDVLLQAHVAGDPDAFGVLFARHRDRLWAVALRTTRDPEEAADALQDALVAAFRRAGSFRGDAAVTTWLHRIVVNACLDRLRRSAVRRAEPLPDDLDETSPQRASAAVPASAGVVDPADLAVDSERRAAVLAALATLPPEQRAALVLVDLEGCSVEETAALLGCAPGTVKSRCSRGRARLLPLLLDHRPGTTRPPAPDAPAPRRHADPGSAASPLPSPGNPVAVRRVPPTVTGGPAPPGPVPSEPVGPGGSDPPAAAGPPGTPDSPGQNRSDPSRPVPTRPDRGTTAEPRGGASP